MSNDKISLLDYFAAKAMQAMCAGEGARMLADRDERYDETNWAQIVADNSYNFAEAMILERQKRMNP
jgi:hypothetical protein